jgi:hypothetical protein
MNRLVDHQQTYHLVLPPKIWTPAPVCDAAASRAILRPQIRCEVILVLLQSSSGMHTPLPDDFRITSLELILRLELPHWETLVLGSCD